jgi:hypothetical protein
MTYAGKKTGILIMEQRIKKMFPEVICGKYQTIQKMDQDMHDS